MPMKATAKYNGLALLGIAALIFSAAATMFGADNDHHQEKEDKKYHLKDDHKEPVKLKIGEEIAVQARNKIKRKWEYGSP